jgi:pilus assembly protein Flp/PilA
MRLPVRKFLADRRGATSIEYAFIAILIAVAIVGAITTLGTNLAIPYTNVANGLK